MFQNIPQISSLRKRDIDMKLTEYTYENVIKNGWRKKKEKEERRDIHIPRSNFIRYSLNEEDEEDEEERSAGVRACYVLWTLFDGFPLLISTRSVYL